MSIPKIINYCWFGKNPLPGAAQKCIKSWEKFCPDYRIVLWNEENFDFSGSVYAKQAYETGKWAFVCDYARLKIIYEQGGIYLDTDVELLRSLDELTENYSGFFGFENDEYIATGLGFGAEAGNFAVGAMLEEYEKITFIKEDGSLDMLPCPKRNTEALKRAGIAPRPNESLGGTVFLAKEVLCPMDYYTGKKRITPRTVSVHHYAGSWSSAVSRRTTRLKRLIGVKNYDRLYSRLLYKSDRWEW